MKLIVVLTWMGQGWRKTDRLLASPQGSMSDEQLKAALLDRAIACGLADRSEDLRLDFPAQRLTNITTGKNYVAKGTSNPQDTLQLRGEAEGLRRMDAVGPGICPKLHYAGKLEDSSCAIFLSDFVHLGRSSSRSLSVLAGRMASELHEPHYHSDVQQYGFPVPTHCGVTLQDNTWEHV